MWGYIQSGVNEGAKAIVGGKGWDGKGFYILPTGKLVTELVQSLS